MSISRATAPNIVVAMAVSAFSKPLRRLPFS